MLTPLQEIKEQIDREHFQYIFISTDPQSYLTGLAEAEIPVYSQDIVKEWMELPSEDTDRWVELFVPYRKKELLSEEYRIEDFMKMDLFLFYQNAYEIMYEELKEEKGIVE
jgi:hypothetical protein